MCTCCARFLESRSRQVAPSNFEIAHAQSAFPDTDPEPDSNPNSYPTRSQIAQLHKKRRTYTDASRRKDAAARSASKRVMTNFLKKSTKIAVKVKNQGQISPKSFQRQVFEIAAVRRV